jgi:hypothetical protein
MLWMYVFLGIALVAAVAVFLFASVVTRTDDRNERQGPPTGLKGFWRDFRAGLSSLRGRSAEDRAAASAKPIDSGMEEFFAATEVHDPAYIDADEITDVLQRAKTRATHTLHSAGVVRRPHSGAASAPAAPQEHAPSPD